MSNAKETIPLKAISMFVCCLCFAFLPSKETCVNSNCALELGNCGSNACVTEAKLEIQKRLTIDGEVASYRGNTQETHAKKHHCDGSGKCASQTRLEQLYILLPNDEW